MKNFIITFVFIVFSISAFSQNIIRGEYFIDSDPGFGNATGFIVANPDSDFTHVFTIPFASFPGPGYHNLFFRTQDSNNVWSQTTRNFIDVGNNSNISDVLKAEYFFSADNGFGNNSYVLLDASPDNTWNFNIPFDMLPTDWKTDDTLFLRVQENTNNTWSQTSFIDSLNFVMVGIEDIEKVTGVSVFPNPFFDEIGISSKNENNLRVLFYNNAGKLLIDKTVNNYEKINTQSLASGVYLIVFYVNDQRLFGVKVVKR